MLPYLANLVVADDYLLLMPNFPIIIGWNRLIPTDQPLLID
jgi:hypothetical protein